MLLYYRHTFILRQENYLFVSFFSFFHSILLLSRFLLRKRDLITPSHQHCNAPFALPTRPLSTLSHQSFSVNEDRHNGVQALTSEFVRTVWLKATIADTCRILPLWDSPSQLAQLSTSRWADRKADACGITPYFKFHWRLVGVLHSCVQYERAVCDVWLAAGTEVCEMSSSTL